MAFEKQWEAYRAQKAVERQAAIEQARVQWLGCRVWVRSMGRTDYGEVTDISDQGRVHIDCAPNDLNCPWVETGVAALGRDVTLADS